MSNISGDLPLRIWQGRANVRTIVLDNSAAQTLFKSQGLIIDISEDTVYGRQFVDAITVATGDVFLGICMHKKVVLTTDTEVDNKMEFYGHDSVVGFLMSAYGTFTNADLGKTLYLNTASTDTLTATAGSNIAVGVLEAVEDGYAYVRIVAPVQQA